MNFKEIILKGIPDSLPQPKAYNTSISHAPKRKDLLSKAEKQLAVRNGLRYFNHKHHADLAPEFAS